MEKKNLISSVLLIALIISGLGNIYLMNPKLSSEPYSDCCYDLVIGTLSGLATLELVDSWDKASNDMLYQVVETLFSYDLYDLDLPRINRLAYSYWWENSTKLHIRLREGILFHDYTPLNAEAAKWNLDRLQYLTNNTGTNFGAVAHTQSLWRFPDGETPIMDTITAVGEYNITITLNAPYGPFLNTLTYINAGMISPSAHASDETSFIDLTTGDVVGTGPFVYDRFKPNMEVILSRWDRYWRKPANFISILYAIYSDETIMNNAFLSYTIDALISFDPTYIPSYENDLRITVKHFTEDTGLPSLTYQYLGFNNEKYNVTWRKTISYAINYTYIIEELRGGNVIRAISPISPGIGSSYNSSSRAATYNLTKAREIMQSMGFGVGYTADWQWTEHAHSANGSSPFYSLPFDYEPWNSFGDDLAVQLINWFKLIGIEIVFSMYLPWELHNILYNDYDHLGLYIRETEGWNPDYLDPFNIIEPLFGSQSGSNSAQVNDTKLNSMMALALETTDDEARNIIYKNIQSYMANEGYFHGYLYHPKITYVHAANIYGVPYNTMGKFEVYGIYRSLYPI